MAVSLNALTLKINSNVSGLTEGVKAVRADINRVNRVLRSSEDASSRLQRATNSLTKVYEAGVISQNTYRQALQQVEGEKRKAAASTQDNANALKKAEQIVASGMSEREKLLRQLRELKTEHEKGGQNAYTYARAMDVVKERLRAMSVAGKELSAEEQRRAERLKRVNAIVDQSVPKSDLLRTRLAELRLEYRRGNITQEGFSRANRYLLAQMDQARPKIAAVNNGIRQQTTTTAGLTSRLERARRAMAGVTSEMRKQEAAGQGLIAKLKGLAAVYLGFNAIRGAFDTFIKLEQASVALEVLTGSAERAKEMIVELKQLDRDAPSFGFEQLQSATKTMLLYGVSQQEVIKRTAQLSEISAGNAENLQSLALAFAQVSAQGRLMGQEVRQFVNAGFNPLQQISEDTGLSMLELKKRMEAGEISANAVALAMERATSEGGLFFEMNKKLAESFGGSLMKLLNTIQMTASDLVSVLSPAIATVLRGMSALIETVKTWTSGLSASNRQAFTFVASMTAFLAIVPGIIGAIRGIVAAIKAWRIAQITLLALTGPRGWAMIAASVVAAGIAVASVEAAFAEEEAALKRTENAAISAAEAMNQYGLSVESAGIKQLEASGGWSTTAQEEIERLKQRNQLLQFGQQYLDDQRFKEDGISKLQEYNLRKLREQNIELEKAKKAEQDRIAALKTRQEKFRSDAENLRQEAERVGEQFRTPFQELVDELTKLNRLKLDAGLSTAAFEKAKGLAVSRFGDQVKPIRVELPPSIMKGSREEYRLLAERQNKTAQQATRRHIEMLAEARAQRKASERAAKASEDSAKEAANIAEEIRNLSLGEAV